VIIVLTVHGTKIVLVHVRRDVASEGGAGVLVESKMDAAVDTRVADVVRDLVEGRVMEGQAGDGRAHHDDVMIGGAVHPPQDFRGAIAAAAVVGRIAGEAGRENYGL